MLQEISIKGLGVIAEAVLPLSPGLNVLTGETGAGKTMVVSGLDLLLGARADASLVRDGVPAATIEGVVDVGADHPAARRAAEAGADVAGGLILARSLSAEGRSRAHVGGRVAPVGLLADLGELLVAVHGQADQSRLRQPEQHRVLLDRFAGERVAVPFRAYRERYVAVQDVRAELSEVSANERERVRELDVLHAGLAEIDAAAPQPQEDVRLREEDERLTYADELRAAAVLAHALMTGQGHPGGDPGADIGADGGGIHSEDADLLTLLGRARAALAPMAAHDPVLSVLAERMQELGYLASDLGGDLAAYLADMELEPARLAWVQDRRAVLARLQRRYGDTVDDVLEWARAAAVRVDRLEHADERAAALRRRLDQLQGELSESAARLSSARQSAAADLEVAVTRELEHLAMGAATISVIVSPPAASMKTAHSGDGIHFGPHGTDDVEIMLAARPGAPGRSVARTASGGELSRVMLALEVVSNSADVPTFVFDEVDAGIGGAAALDVGARLARLSRGAQVIVVTHLAQVAAYADQHLVVHKADGRVIASGVAVVDGDARVRELARMMAGAQTPVALAHARELLEYAASDAAPTPAAPGAKRPRHTVSN